MGFFNRLKLASEIMRGLGDTPNNLLPPRATGKYGSAVVSNDSALRTSAVWAAIRLRADLVSTMPLQIKRKNPDGSISILDTPALSIEGIGGTVSIEEWLYSSQTDLDLTGNAIGLVKQRDPLSGRPTWIELQQATSVRVQSRNGVVGYVIGGTEYDASDVWHEKQFTVSGFPVGLNPLRYASMVIGSNLSAQQFGLEYFAHPGLPTAHVKNTSRTLNTAAAQEIKHRYEAALEERGPWVTGADWTVDIKSISADESQFLQTLDSSAQEIVRYFGVPGDLIDVNPSGASVTYANITQRMMGFLILNLQPALVRRERKISRDLLPNKVFAKFDTDELLRLDPASQASVDGSKIAARWVAPDEIRMQNEMPPLTPEQLAQIKDLVAVAPLAPPKLRNAEN